MKKIIYSVCILFLLFMSCSLASCKKDKIKNIEVVFNQGDAVFYENENLDDLRSHIKVYTVDKRNNKTEISNYILSGKLTEGISCINVSYATHTTSFNVFVTTITPISVKIESFPQKTSYIETDPIDLTGLVARVYYNNGTSHELTTYTCDKTNISINDTSINISYNGLSASIPITVEKKITALNISRAPEKLSYISGEKLDLTGLEVTATYLDGTSSVIDTTSNIPNGNPVFASDKLCLSAQGISIDMPIEVKYKEYGDYLLSLTYSDTQYSAPSGFKISKYTGTDTKISLPEECDNLPINEIDNYAFQSSNLVLIIVGEHILTVHSNSFYDCENTVICHKASTKPSGWDNNWNKSDSPVIWGYSTEESVNDFEYGIVDGKVYITAYNGNDSAVIVPNFINNYPVVYILSAFIDKTNITHVILPDSILELGYNCFYGCINLKSINIPYGIISIGDNAFAKCQQLSSITLPDSIISIGSQAFAYCYSLQNIRIPNNLTVINNNLFEYCESLKSITIGDSVSELPTTLFNGCDSLANISVSENNPFYKSINGNIYTKDGKILVRYAPGKNESSFSIPDHVINIDAFAFYGVSELKNIQIPSSVTHIGRFAFSCCEKLSSINLSSAIISVGDYAFSSCSNLIEIICESKYITKTWGDAWKNNCNAKIKYLTTETEIVSNPKYNYIVVNGEAILTRYKGNSTEITIPKTIDNLYNVASFGQIFKGTSIVSISIPDSISNIESQAFSGCSSLANISIPSSIVSIGSYAFYQCSNLQNVYIDDIASWCNISLSDYSAPLQYAKNLYVNGELITNLVIPEGVTVIPHHAFAKQKSIVSVSIPESLEVIQDLAFDGCSISDVHLTNLSSWCNVVIYDMYDSPLCIADNIYINNELITQLVIPDDVTTINDFVFYGLKNITDITISSSVTAIGRYAFGYCRDLENVFFNSPKLVSIESYAFSDCEKLLQLYIPDSVSHIGEGIIKNCYGLTRISLPSCIDFLSADFFGNLTNLEKIEIKQGNTFYRSIDGCVYDFSGKKLIRVPNNSSCFVIVDGVEEICDYAFSGCNLLKTVTIPNSVISIGSYAFYNCSSITAITIPDSVISIGAGAFYNCSRLENLSLSNRSLLKIGNGAFMNCNIENVYITNIFNWCNIIFESESANPLAYSKNFWLEDELLINVVIPNGITHISDYVFYGYRNLQSVSIPASVISINDTAFDKCDYLSDFIVDSNNETYLSISGVLYSKDAKCLIKYPCGKADTDFTVPIFVTTINKRAFSDSKNLTSIVLQNGITTIGPSAFINCNNIDVISIPISVKYIDNYAFSACSKLTNVICASKYLSEKWHKYWLSGCNALVTYSVIEEEITSNPDYNYIVVNGEAILTKYKGTSSEISIPETIDNLYKVVGFGKAFMGTDIIKVSIPEGILEIPDNAFSNCEKLVDVSISNSVTSIGENAFLNCQSITNIKIGNGLKFIGKDAFSLGYYGEKYVNVYIEDLSVWFNVVLADYSTSSPLSIGNATLYLNEQPIYELTIPEDITVIRNFAGYMRLHSVIIPNHVTAIDDNAFRGCSNLSEVIFHEESKVVSIGNGAFMNCFCRLELFQITIPESVMYIGEDAFYGCAYLAEINVEDGNRYYKSIDGVLYSIDEMLLIKYPSMKNGDIFYIPDSVKTIGYGAFESCYNLRKILFGNNVTTIKSYAFHNCKHLGTLTIPKNIVTIDDHAFDYDLYVFFENTKENISLGYNMNEQNMFFSSYVPYTFIETSDLKYRIYNGYASVVEYIGKGNTIVIPDSIVVDNINYPVTTIESNSFANARNITSIFIGANISKIEVSALNGCSNLKSLTISENNTCYTVTNGIIYSIDGKKLILALPYSEGNIIIPSGVETIYTKAFEGCNGVTSIFIPSSVHTIASLAFYGAENLESIFVDEGNTVYKSQDGILFNYSMTIIYVYPPAKSGYSYRVPSSIEFIDAYCFNNIALEKIYISHRLIKSFKNSYLTEQELIVSIN